MEKPKVLVKIWNGLIDDVSANIDIDVFIYEVDKYGDEPETVREFNCPADPTVGAQIKELEAGVK